MTRNFSPKIVQDIFFRDKRTCIYCGGIANQIDHVVPYSKGGINIKANGVACCNHCNMKKKGKLSEEYLVKGLVYLARKGEDISWIDSLYTDRLIRLTHAQEYALRLLLQSELSHSEISFLLDIDEETLDNVIGEMDL